MGGWDSIDARFSERDDDKQLAKAFRQVRTKSMQVGAFAFSFTTTSGAGVVTSPWSSDEVPPGAVIQADLRLIGTSDDRTRTCSFGKIYVFSRLAAAPVAQLLASQSHFSLAPNGQSAGLFVDDATNKIVLRANDNGSGTTNWKAWVSFRKFFGDE